MKFDPKVHRRRSLRLKGYDYSLAGAYFVTSVTWQRECMFGIIVNGKIKLNRFGQIVQHAWFDLPRHYRYVSLDAFCIMPNHIHGIIILNDDGRGGSLKEIVTSPDGRITGKSALSEHHETRPYTQIKRHALPEIVRAFKSFSANRINLLRNSTGIPVWQRN